MHVYSFRLICAVALAFATQVIHGDDAEATTNGQAAEFVDEPVTNVYETPLPCALLLLAAGLVVARRAADSDRRRTENRAAT